jgi:UDP-glucose 4-epimerase
VFSSTAAVYGNPATVPIAEDAPTVPTNPYGWTKLAVDMAIALDVAAVQRDHLQLFGQDYPTADGTCVRDYNHIEDLASAHLLAPGAADTGHHKVYNLGTATASPTTRSWTWCGR